MSIQASGESGVNLLLYSMQAQEKKLEETEYLRGTQHADYKKLTDELNSVDHDKARFIVQACGPVHAHSKIEQVLVKSSGEQIILPDDQI